MRTPEFATCPLQWGDWWAADTTRGITLDTNALGKIYHDVGMGTGSKQVADERLVILCKNESGGTLSRNLAVMFDNDTLEWMKIIDGLASANTGLCAGVVEDGYISGVPNGAIFRVVCKGRHYCQYYTSSDSQVTTAPGEALVVAGSGEVYGQDTSVAAGSATFGQTNGVMGFSLEVTTNTTDNGLQKLIYVKTKFV